MLAISNIAYSCWTSMNSRCSDSNNPDYKSYGAKGIKVCKRWRGKNGFKNFIADIGERPSLKYSIDRYPNKDGNYEPGNVRWATSRQQNNNRSTTIMVTYRNKNYPLTVLARKFKISRWTLSRRLRDGWSVEDALSPFVAKGGPKAKVYEYNGKKQDLNSWAVELGVTYCVLYARLHAYGWSIDRVLSTPKIG